MRGIKCEDENSGRIKSRMIVMGDDSLRGPDWGVPEV